MDVQSPELPGRLSLRLDVYSPPQVPARDRRRDEPGVIGESLGAGRRLRGEEGGEDVVALLLVGAQEALLDENERPVAPARGRLDGVAHFIGRRVENDLVGRGRDELEALAAVVIVDRRLVAERLPKLIVAQLLFEPGRHGDERSDPVGLGRLGLVHPIEPVGEIIGEPIRSRLGERLGAVHRGQIGRPRSEAECRGGRQRENDSLGVRHRSPPRPWAGPLNAAMIF